MIQQMNVTGRTKRIDLGPLTMPTVGEWLADAREKIGLSQRSLAAKAGVSSAMVSKLEAGRVNASKEMIIILASALSTDPAPGLIAGGFFVTENSIAEEMSYYSASGKRKIELAKVRGESVFAFVPPDMGEEELKDMKRAVEIALRED